jgi:hypothetical protein
MGQYYMWHLVFCYILPIKRALIIAVWMGTFDTLITKSTLNLEKRSFITFSTNIWDSTIFDIWFSVIYYPLKELWSVQFECVKNSMFATWFSDISKHMLKKYSGGTFDPPGDLEKIFKVVFNFGNGHWCIWLSLR